MHREEEQSTFTVDYTTNTAIAAYTRNVSSRFWDQSNKIISETLLAEYKT